MAVRAMRACRHTGCAGLSPTGWCERHVDDAKVNTRNLERWRGTAASRGYDSEWSRLRVQALKRDMYLCQSCLKDDRVTPAKDVDHIVPFTSVDDPRRTDIDNLQSLCRSCHNAKTSTQRR